MTTRIFPGRYESLANIAELVRSAAKESGLGYTAIFELETAVDEAVSNIIEHAYGGEGIGEIWCSCAPQKDGLLVTLIDHGQPFDPACVPIPDVKALLKDRKNNGLGYFMMCQLVDKVEFVFDKEQNRLTLFKKKTP